MKGGKILLATNHMKNNETLFDPVKRVEMILPLVCVYVCDRSLSEWGGF